VGVREERASGAGERSEECSEDAGARHQVSRERPPKKQICLQNLHVGSKKCKKREGHARFFTAVIAV
jgi:hypothetical protein